MKFLIFTSFTSVLVIAQSSNKNKASSACTNDILIDDFRSLQLGQLYGTTEFVNLVGGDYESTNEDLVFKTHRHAIANGHHHAGSPHMSVVPGTLDGVFLVRPNPGACIDLTQYSGILIDVSFSGDADMTIGIGQKSSDCNKFIDSVDGDSVYLPLSKYARMTPHKRYAIQIPFADFNLRQFKAVSAYGAQFDLNLASEFKFSFTQPNIDYRFYRIALIGSCAGGYGGHNGTYQDVFNQIANATANYVAANGANYGGSVHVGGGPVGSGYIPAVGPGIPAVGAVGGAANIPAVGAGAGNTGSGSNGNIGAVGAAGGQTTTSTTATSSTQTATTTTKSSALGSSISLFLVIIALLMAAY